MSRFFKVEATQDSKFECSWVHAKVLEKILNFKSLTNTRIFFYKKQVYKKPDAGASKTLRNFQYRIFLLQKFKKLILLKSLEKKDTAG